MPLKDNRNKRFQLVRDGLSSTKQVAISGVDVSKALNVHQMIPGLRGLWPMSVFTTSGGPRDMCNNGLDLAVTAVGTIPTFTSHSTDKSVRARVTLTSSQSQTMSVADSTALQILGTESYLDAGLRGLTVGGWVFFNGLGNNEWCWGKYSVQHEYLLGKNSSNVGRFIVSGDGTADVGINTITTLSASTWYHIVGRYDPGAEISIWLDGVEDNFGTSSIPSSIFNGGAAFHLGSRNGSTDYVNGAIGFSFLYGAYVPDAHIELLYESTRAIYGK